MQIKLMPLAAAAGFTAALATSALADNGRHGQRLPQLAPAQPAALLGTCEALAPDRSARSPTPSSPARRASPPARSRWPARRCRRIAASPAACSTA